MCGPSSIRRLAARPATVSAGAFPYAAHGSRIPSESNKGTHDAHAAITHREYVDPADCGTAGRAEAPGLDGGVGADVRQAVLLQHEVRWSVVEDLLGAVVERFPPDAFAAWIDEPHVFGIRPLDGRPALLRVPLGKDVQIHVKQLSCIRHAVFLSSVWFTRALWPFLAIRLAHAGGGHRQDRADSHA